MVAIGPRVGGAHVDVNLKMDDNSIKKVGDRIHKQLKRMSDRNARVYRKIGADAVTAWRAALGAVVSSAPLMGSLVSALAGGVTVLGGALYSFVQSAFGLAPILVAIGIAAGTTAIAMKGFFEAVKSGDMGNLTPSAAAAAQAVRSLSGAWERVRRTVQENFFAGLAGPIRELGTTLLPVLERGLGKMATALNGVISSILEYVNSSAGLKQISRLLDNSADIVDRLGAAVVPFLDGFLRLMNALAPAGKRLADRIAEVAVKFQSWTKAEGFGKRMDDMMKRAEKTAGLLLKVLGNLSGAISNIFLAANPATNRFLELLVGVTDRFKTWTASAEGQNSIAKWAEDSVDVMKQLGSTIEAVAIVLGKLANPRVIKSFLATVEGAFEILAKLPLEAMVTGFADMAEALEPVSSIFLAIIIGGAAFNILLGNLMAQVAGFVSVLLRLTGVSGAVGKFFGTLGGAGKHAASAGKLSTAFKGLAHTLSAKAFPSSGKHIAQIGKHATTAHRAFGPFKTALKGVTGLLGRFAKFAGPVGITIWIGSIIAKSDKLQKKFGEVWGAIKEVGSSLSGAFSEIGAALKPLAPVADKLGSAIGTVFGWIDKLAEIAIGVFLDMVIYGFKSLANVIKGVGSIVAGFINIITSLFKWDFDGMWDGLKQMASGVVPLLKGLFGLFVTFFAPAKFLKLAGGAIKGLGSGIASAVPPVLAFVGKFVVGFLKFFLTLPLKLLSLGGKAITAIFNAVKTHAPKVLSAAGNLVTGVITWIAKLPGQLLTLGGRAITSLFNAVKTHAPKVLSAAGNIVTGVITWIAKLPGRLLTLGTKAVSQLAGAVKTGIGKLRTIATSILTAITGVITKLPGRLLTFGTQAITKFSGAVRTGVSKVRTIAGDIVSAITGKIKSLPGEMLSLGKNMIKKLADGITAGIKFVKDAAGKVAGAIKNVLPGSPVKDGPLKAWNYGGDATGGGRNVIDAITGGLRNTSPIKKAMDEVASAVSATLSPTVGAGALGGGSVTNSRNLSVVINNPQSEPSSDSLTRTTRNLAYLGLA